MDFRLSYNWLKEFVDVRALPEELADRLSLHSVSVERLRRMGEGLDPKVVIGRVERIDAHPNADKLRVAYVATHPHPHAPPTPHKGRRETKKNFSPSHREGERLPAEALAKAGEGVWQFAKVVCGGTNLREGMLVAFAPPGTMVRWHGQGDPVELKPTEIRGVRSDGMICAASEIGLGEYFSEAEREILDLASIPSGVNGQVSGVGNSLAAALGLDDVILDCEITTNRPDLMSVVGLAREVAAITGSELRELGSYKLQATSYKLPHPHVLPLPVGGGVRGGGKGLRLEAPTISCRDLDRSVGTVGLQLRIADRSACPRYGAVVIDGVQVGSSPWWVQRRLLAAGLRPINNVVDATNYVMLEMGQPLHAFDAVRLQRTVPPLGVRGGEGELRADRSPSQPPRNPSRPPLTLRGGARTQGIVIRRARAGESLRALDGNTYQLRTEDLVIASPPSPEASEGKAIAIAGVIGGEETGVTKETTRVVLECANFDSRSVRRTSRALGIRTESSIRFEKGLPLESVDHTIARAAELLRELAGGIASRPVIVGTTPPRLPSIRLEPKRVADRIGAPITPASMQRTLTALGCRIQKKTSGFFFVTPPWWRRGDLEGSHDLVEEIARVHGYHQLPSVLPTGTLPSAVQPPRPPQSSFDWEDRARGILTGAGTTEVLTYSLTSRDAIERCGYTTDQAIALENPLSEELAYLRPSVIPTLLPLIAQNQGHTPSAVVFEMGNVFIPAAGQQSNGTVPPLGARGGEGELRTDRNPSQPPLTLRGGGRKRHLAVLPREEMRLLIAAYGRMVSGGHVMQVKGIVEHLLERLGIRDATFRPSEQCALPTPPSPPSLGEGGEQKTISHPPGRGSERGRGMGTCLWHPGRTMDVVAAGTLVGVLGEVHPSVVEQFGIDQRVAAAELDWAPILAACGAVVAPASPVQFPAVKRDLAFTVDRKTPYTDIAAVLERFDPLLSAFELFDQYEGGNLSLGKKSLAFHLTFEHPDRTLTAAEADALLTRLTVALQQRFEAEARE